MVEHAVEEGSGSITIKGDNSEADFEVCVVFLANVSKLNAEGDATDNAGSNSVCLGAERVTIVAIGAPEVEVVSDLTEAEGTVVEDDTRGDIPLTGLFKIFTEGSLVVEDTDITGVTCLANVINKETGSVAEVGTTGSYDVLGGVT